MNKYIYIFLVAFLLTSCGKSFLDQEPNGGYITPEQIEKESKWNPLIMLGQSYGITQTTFKHYSGGTDNHDDFGQKSVDIATDVMTGDIALSSGAYPWFADDAELKSNGTTAYRARIIWRYYFQIIKSTNLVFDGFGGDKNIPELYSNRIVFAQAKALRAQSYFNLVNLYNRTYDLDKDQKSLPIYRSQLTSKAEGLSTVDSVYRFIISDLLDAKAVFEEEDYERPISSGIENKSEVNLAVVEGLLAYVYLNKGEYDKAVVAANNALTQHGRIVLPKASLFSTGFNTTTIDTWMWGIDVTTENTGALVTFWGNMDVFTYGYAWAGSYKQCDEILWNSIPNSDSRKNWFSPNISLSPINKFFNSKRDINNPDRQWTDDLVFMRTEEMFLIAAEANLRKGALQDAKNVLKELIRERDAVYVSKIDTMDDTELLEYIYFNWRVEMWGEGKSLQTLKRFKKPSQRGANNYSMPGTTINWDSPKFLFEIPELEILNNPNLSK